MRALKGKNQRLKNLLEEKTGGSAQELKRKKGADTLSDLEIRYFGIASKVWRSLSVSCGRESFELYPFQNCEQSTWEFSREAVESPRISASPHLMIAPYPGDSTVSSGIYFTPSSSNQPEFLN